jgi:hypothetical protein
VKIKTGTTPAMTATERSRKYRAECKRLGRPDSSQRYKKQHRAEARRWANMSVKPFVGCDGEGCGKDDKGRQLYMLFRMGDRELFTGEPLRTEEILNFICDAPRHAIYVGFAFGYDATMAVRDFSHERLTQLVKDRDQAEADAIAAGRVTLAGKAIVSRSTWFKRYNVEYVPKQYFRVSRVTIERNADGREVRVPVPDSSRTIYETFGFFQKSFVKVITEFDCGTAKEREAIAADKARRSSFDGIGPRERKYCALECDLLAELMEKFRVNCGAADILPRTWNGAGKLAKALHTKNGTMTRDQVAATVPPAVLDMGGQAYYGGRFEISRGGLIREDVHEYDIGSAYPAAMRELPCLVHGLWKKAPASQLAKALVAGKLFVARCSFKTPASSPFGGLPIRGKTGSLFWPLQGGGIYWSVEIASAKRLGAKIKFENSGKGKRAVAGWVYEKKCDCCPFAWVQALYDYRKSLDGQRGHPIKLAINALYGQLVQRVGKGKFVNMVWGSLITAITRARLNDAVARDPGAVVMLATDGIYTTRPLKGLDQGDGLGQWGHKKIPGLFLVQPGLYWSPRQREEKRLAQKSRGLSGQFFAEPGRTESFEAAWLEFADHDKRLRGSYPFPQVAVPVPGFIGVKLAVARGKPDLAGCWVQDRRSISFDHSGKRAGYSWNGSHIITRPKQGSAGLVSLPHREFVALGGSDTLEFERLVLDEQPDFIDLSIPFKD